MMRVGSDNLFTLIHDFLKVYLPRQRKVSPHTIRSYSNALNALIDYVKAQKSIPMVQITFELLSADMILSWLASLDESGCSDATRNSRCAAVRAFLEYASDHDVTVVPVLKELKKISFRKPSVNRLVDYLTMDAISAIVEQTDENTPKGFRDRVFLIMMYDTAARVQEMLDICLCDLDFDSKPKVTIHGKGDKSRTLPLMDKTMRHIQKYIDEFHPGLPLSSDNPLFYTVRNGKMRPLTDRAVRYMIQEYGQKARNICPEVPENVYPHLFRHSRAMHLYQAGVDLTLISQWLGHADVETTEIYAHADAEHKRKAIAASTPPDNPLYSKLNSARYTVSNEELVKRLVGLR